MVRSSPTVLTPPSPDEVRTAFVQELGPRERSVFLAWLAFTATFGAVRGITYSIRAGRSPFHDLALGGRHLHHYLWGIAITSWVAGQAVGGHDRTLTRPGTALAFGAGQALIVDEFALLLDLEDVYWAKQGRVSVDLGIGLIALGGMGFVGAPVLRRLVRNRRERRPAPGLTTRGDAVLP